MGAVPSLSIVDRASVSVAREQVRTVGRELGLPKVVVEELAIVASELAQNQLDHAGAGTLLVRPIERNGVAGIELVARDRGPGIADPAAAFAGQTVPRGLGAGLSAIRRLATELDLDVRTGEGTDLRARRFAGPVPVHPEVCVLGRGVEQPSGDHAWVRRFAGGVLVAAVDGVGHGTPAREASDLAVTALSATPSLEPEVLLQAVHHACRGSRGVAASIARWDVSPATITVAGVGNVVLRLYGSDHDARTLLPTPGILGAGRPRHTSTRTFPLGSHPVLILHTDGLVSGTDPQETRGLLLRSPLHVAQHLLTHDSRDHDDALVVVVR